MATSSRRTPRRWVEIDGCPCPATVAPYAWLVLRRAGQSASAIYRGDDPAAGRILRAHGKHTQRQLWDATPAQRARWGVTGVPNRPGRSDHELLSDGAGHPEVPVGEPLADWMVAVDSGANDDRSRAAIERAARELGWQVRHPYRAGVEGHHWVFARRPRPRGPRQLAVVLSIRRRLRRLTNQ